MTKESFSVKINKLTNEFIEKIREFEEKENYKFSACLLIASKDSDFKNWTSTSYGELKYD